jgi:hypothetical protein
MINYIVIGAGWRAEFYLRIARQLPEIFNVSAVCARNADRARELSQKYGVKVVKTVDEALGEKFDFVVNCINKEDISDFAVSLADSGYYVLCETPIICAPKAGHAYDKIQVAEQFHLKGTYQAIKKIIDSGIIGEVNHINLSMAHDYHGMSLIRFLLDEYEKPQKISDHTFESPLLKTNGRAGELEDKYLDKSVQKIKVYSFGDKTAVYDFTDDQYFSPIRKDRILIRGTRGEIDNNYVRYFNENDEFIESEIILQRAGLLDGFYNDRIVFESKVLFDFPFKRARLSEEETAIAQCLLDMKEYVETGKELYSFEKAYRDYSYFEM